MHRPSSNVSHHVHCQHAGMIVSVATLSAKPGNWSGISVGCVPSSHKQPDVGDSIYNGSYTRGNSRRSGSTLSTRASVTQELCGGPWTHCFNLHRSATPTNSLLNSSLGFSKRRSSPYDCPPRLPTHWSSLLGV